MNTYAIKVHVIDIAADEWKFDAQKTMYEGKKIKPGDKIFVFNSENEGGQGLIAVGSVVAAQACRLVAGADRQTPRVSIVVRRTGLATRALGRSELRSFASWNDGRPETELNFKLYRQATNKIVGVSEAAATFLEGCVGDTVSENRQAL